MRRWPPTIERASNHLGKSEILPGTRATGYPYFWMPRSQDCRLAGCHNHDIRVIHEQINMERKIMLDKAPLAVSIVVGNQKGGVGKSTNACHLAAALGKRGRRILLIDLDPHAGATKHLGVPGQSYAGSLELLTAEEELEALTISEGMPSGVELIASRTELAELERRVSKYLDTTRLLEHPLRQARKRFDYIILDTPPAARSIATISAYSEAEWILLSAFPHHLSVEGLAEAFRDINDVRKFRNRKLEVLGILLCCVDRRVKKSRQKIEDLVASAIPGREFCTSISQATVLPESSALGLTIFQRPDASDHRVTQQYRKLAAEVEHRVRNRHKFLTATLDPMAWQTQASVEVIQTRTTSPNPVHAPLVMTHADAHRIDDHA